MFLDDQFYELLKKCDSKSPEKVSDVVFKIHRIVNEHLKVEVIDKLDHRGDRDLFIVCRRIDKQFRTAVKRLKNEGYNNFNPDLMITYFKVAHPEIAKHLYES